jgi:hypothetical protein
MDPMQPFITKYPNIHKIIKDVTLNGNCINIKNLNQKLEEELTKLKSTQEQIGIKLAIPDNKYVCTFSIY